MTAVLFVLFCISIIAPVYTYAVYPLILRCIPEKKFKTDNEYYPLVSVVIIPSDADTQKTDIKCNSIKSLDYPQENIEVFVFKPNTSNGCTLARNAFINDAVRKAKGDIIFFTDTDTQPDALVLKNVVSRFADERVACVCGQQRKKDGNQGLFWKYENLVKSAESRFGRLSGAGDAVFAVKKELVPNIPKRINDYTFYIANTVSAGKSALFEDKAVVYEEEKAADSINFGNHIEDGFANFQLMTAFCSMLIPRFKNFVYISHRVMKWFVPLNMLFALITSAALSFYSTFMAVLFVLQVLGYAFFALYYVFIVKKSIKIGGPVGALIGAAFYFVALNVAWGIGMIKYIFGGRVNESE